MTSRRSGLGRGLDALIPNLQPAVESVDIDLIAPNPQQPRSVFDADALTELAESIREHGIIQPLIVSRPAKRGAATYQLIAGERRLLAARQAGLERVPVIVKEATPQALLELALVENLQRADLGPLEEAVAFKRLGDEFKLTQESIATRVGRSRSAVANS
ncbi:MAG TPA: ParB/RepB/Spo0J family partition protein, partial [Dehalococcoidia bacterium]|nr:ParB/RepB/Spo0J family partition protein [Dehalococcoidia bacterium]